MELSFVFVIFIILISNVQYTIEMNQYIYLPDKSVLEEIQIGSLIVDLNDELNAYYAKHTSTTQKLTTTSPQQFTFLEDVKQTSDNNYFLLDSMTGRITTKRYLDRENLCMNRHCIDPCDSNYLRNNCKINLKILLIPSYSILSINILVLDINDNRPQFRSDSMNQSIPENVPIGYRVPIDLAYDPDYGTNSIQYYAFVDAPNLTSMYLLNDTFELVQNLSDSQLALVVKKKLDRETISSYHFIIAAYDGGTPPFSGQLEIFIEITDINDNNPKFTQDFYKFSVFENTEVGSEIGEPIKAIDLDAGLNGKVKYSIVNIGNGAAAASIFSSDSQVVQQDYYMKYFEINENTGVITLKMELDYETEQFYSLTIEAKDSGVGSLPAYANVEIYVIDCNDNRPEISVSFLNTLQRNTTENNELIIYISENMQSNKYIAHVSIFDKDSQDNGKVDWKVFINNTELTSDDSGLIMINRLNNNSFTLNSGLKSFKVMDREAFCCLSISIYSWDYGTPTSKVAYYNFTFVLLDENDNKPKFERAKYDFKIIENNRPFDIIGYLNATDLDVGENSRISYSVKESELQKLISIDSNGTIRALKVFDREDRYIYRFSVIASDNGKPSLSATVPVELLIIDQNDNAPKISFNTSFLNREQLPNKNTLVLSLDENLQVETEIARFSYTDQDEGENGKAKFFIQQRNLFSNTVHDALPFKLTSDGILTLENRLDREKKQSYEFTIECQDLSIKMESFSTELNVIVYIADINDNCPFGLNTTKTGFINKDSYFNNTLPTDNSKNLFQSIYADYDIGKNSELKFTLLTYDDLFEIIQTPARSETRNVITISFKFRIFKTNNIANYEKFAKQLKLGKYVLRLKISDNGDPMCIINEVFVLVIGDNQYDKNEILNKLKLLDKKTLLFVNDNEYDIPANTNNSNIKLNSKVMVSGKTNVDSLKVNKQKSQTTFTANDYLLLIALIAIVVIIAIFFSLIATVYFYSKYKKQTLRKEKSKKHNLEEGKLLSGNSSCQNSDSPDNTEILYHDNRYSFSVKSNESDRSNSADSVMSSAYTKETKSSNSYQNDLTVNQNTTYKNYSLSTFDHQFQDVPKIMKYKPVQQQDAILDHSHLYSTLNHHPRYLTLSQIKDKKTNRNGNGTLNLKYKCSNKDINSLYQHKDEQNSDMDEDSLFVSQKNLNSRQTTYDYKSSAV